MRFHVRTAVIGAVLYLYVFGTLLVTSKWLFLLALVYSLVCVFGARAMIQGAESRRSDGNRVEFSKHHPATVLGNSVSSFQYVFDCSNSIVEKVQTYIANDLVKKLGASEIKSITFADIDRDLPKAESRAFGLMTLPPTPRDTRLSVLIASSRQSTVQGIRWWIFELGNRDPNKVFWRYALAPIQVPFQVIPYIRREFEPLHTLRSVDPGFFNGVDRYTRTREIERVTIDALVESLDGFGVDTNELKQQRANVLNISVGGKATAAFGTLVQGAFNRVAGKAAA
jgi:hypothetical protein